MRSLLPIDIGTLCSCQFPRIGKRIPKDRLIDEARAATCQATHIRRSLPCGVGHTQAGDLKARLPGRKRHKPLKRMQEGAVIGHGLGGIAVP